MDEDELKNRILKELAQMPYSSRQLFGMFTYGGRQELLELKDVTKALRELKKKGEVIQLKVSNSGSFVESNDKIGAGTVFAHPDLVEYWARVRRLV